jgi:Cu(I)/Ag(I) efflux system membrane fusion protein
MELIPLEQDDSDGGGLRELSVSENAKKLMDIETVPVERKFVEAEIRMVGKVDYDETKLKYITAWIPGRLDRLYVDYTGVPVKKGDHMVYLYSPELLGAQEELLQAIEAAKNLKDSEYALVRDSTDATVTATREKLRLWGLLPEQIAEIETRGQTTDHMTIYSPTGGIVVHKNAQEGMYVNTGTRIYTIADLSQVWVHLDAYESDLIWLRYGQKVEFTTESYPGEVFFGTISFIDPILSQKTRTVKMRVNAPNLEMKLKPGMFVRAVARANIAAGGRIMDAAMKGKWICPMHPDVVKENAGSCDICEMPLVKTESLGFVGVEPEDKDKPLVIPDSAPLLTGTRAIVYVQVPDSERPTFEGREIVLGPHAGNYYLVRSGLEEGELVVTRGNFKIDAELQIRAKPSMMTPEGGGGGGGHQHGDAPVGATDESGGMVLDMPVIIRAQLSAVLSTTHDAVKAAASGDPAKANSAFTLLEQKIKEVQEEKLSGHAGMLWKEYSMLLSNDCIEGKSIKKPSDLKQLADTLKQHSDSMRSKFGISQLDKTTKVSTISENFRNQLHGVLEAYLAMQQALAGDDREGAVSAAQDASAALNKVDMKLLTGEDHMEWMKHDGELKKILSKAREVEGIEPVRQAFALLSDQMMATVKRFGTSGSVSLFQFKCPMAFNNRGATWIQSDDETRNPYFGDAMLRCGEVIEILPGADEKGGH